MDCEQGSLLLNARMDGELSAEDRHRLTLHLDECAACRISADEFERVDRELARNFLVRQRSVVAVADRVMEAWLEEAPLRSRRWTHFRWASAVAAGFALALLLFGSHTWIGSNGRHENKQVHTMVEEWKKGDVSYESELRLRSQGSACVMPLADVVRTRVGDANDAKRLEATRVLCDLAEKSHIPTLIELLGDTSPEIRSLSEASLVRLTGRDGHDRRGPSLAQITSCSNPQAEWREWWEKNKERFERSDP